MIKLAVAGMIILGAAAALLFFEYFWLGLVFLLSGIFLADLLREKVMAEVSKRQGDNGNDSH